MNLLANFIHALKLFSQRNYTPMPKDAVELELKQTVSELAVTTLSEFKVAVKIKNEYVFYKNN